MLSGAGLLLRGPPLSPGVVRGVGTTSRDPLPRAPLSVGASAAEWEILDGKRVDLQSGAPGQAGPGSLLGCPQDPKKERKKKWGTPDRSTSCWLVEILRV